ncbi:DUF1931 family protein [Streptomyces sp. ID05-39B]|uniref:DUF1931 family protein n=1 Tax=Streptomyces sp. ID05-39B TaxID=3028664 RepID=UPI0029B09E56|nr:DUF1931 family protein [Streptomyces sp. ID05-39B]MDX3525750.1 DUF1931 family protein [Streptomyces sp. ID05-39B]
MTYQSRRVCRRASPLPEDEIELRPILEQLATYPALDRTPDEETEAAYPDIIGGPSLALAQSFKILTHRTEGPTARQPRPQPHRAIHLALALAVGIHAGRELARMSQRVPVYVGRPRDAARRTLLTRSCGIHPGHEPDTHTPQSRKRYIFTLPRGVASRAPGQ